MLALYEDDEPRVRYALLQLVPIPPPEAHDRMMALLMDPDPPVRYLAEQRLLAVPERSPQLALPLLRFLARDDLDDRARQMAEEALRVRGYTAESGPSGIRAVPLDDRRPVIELPPE
jgi:HEAT repeat protein